jgi:hypothetical protein
MAFARLSKGKPVARAGSLPIAKIAGFSHAGRSADTWG